MAIPRLRHGTKVTAETINRLLEDIERAQQVSFGPGITGSQSASGIAIASLPAFPPPQDHDIIFNDAGQWGTAHDVDNVYGILGRVRIGSPMAADAAVFSHIDFASVTDYALAQKNLGMTFLNAPTGQYISFRINDVEKMRLDAAGNLYGPKFFDITDPTYWLDLDAAVTGLNLKAGAVVGGFMTVGTDLDVSGNAVITGTAAVGPGIGAPLLATVQLYVKSSTATRSAAAFSKDFTAATHATVRMFQGSMTGAIPVLSLEQNDISEGYIDFIGTMRPGIDTTTVASWGSIRVEINGVVRRLAYWLDA